MRKANCLIMLVVSFVFSAYSFAETNLGAQDDVSITFPRIAVYGTSQNLHIHTVNSVKGIDLLILDFENWVNNPENILLFKEKNPETKIFAYVNPMEVYYGEIPRRPLNLELSVKVLGLTKMEIGKYSNLKNRRKEVYARFFESQLRGFNNDSLKGELEKIDEELNGLNKKIKDNKYSKWLLWTTLSNKAVFYTPLPYWMMNLSENSPEVDGKKWNRFIAEFYFQYIPKEGDLRPDGVFQDNSTADVHWMNNFSFNAEEMGYIDSNLDGEADKEEMLNPAWKQGQINFVSYLREHYGDDFLVLGNKGKPEYDPNIYDGKMFEEFPFIYGGMDKRAGGWFQCMENYFITGPYSIIHSPVGDKERILFGLASALMGDGYFAIDHNNFIQNDLSEDIGRALGPHTRHEEGLSEAEIYWERKFEKAIVRVFPYKRKGEIIRLP